MPRSSKHISVGQLRSMLRELAETAEVDTKQQNEKQVTALIAAYKAENLVLVLGSGVSVDLGLLDWSTLLQKLLISSIVQTTKENAERSNVLAKLFSKIFKPNPLIAARHLSNFYTKE